MDVLLGPAHLRDVDQALHTWLELDEGAVVGVIRYRALESGADGVFGGDAFPWVGFELLDAKADSLGLGVDADDLHFHRVANIHDLGRMVDASPCHVGDMQKPVDAAEVDEGAIVGDVLHHAVDDLTLFEAGYDLAPLLGARLFEHRTARDDDVTAAAIHFQDVEGLRLVHQRTDIADRTNVDLASRQECNGAVEIDGEAALDAVEDHAFDALAGLVFLFEPGPALLAARLLARQHCFPSSVLDTLEIDVDLLADVTVGGAAGYAEFFEGDAAFGFQPNVDHSDVFLDPDDGALDDTALLQGCSRERLLEKCRELVAARMAHACLRFGHLGSYSPSHHKLQSWSSLSKTSEGHGRRWRLPVPGCRPPHVCPRKTSKNGAPMQNGQEPQTACPAWPVAASIRSMAALNAASISKFVVSSKTASSARLSGAAARPSSRSSRRLMSASTSVSETGIPARFSSQ